MSKNKLLEEFVKLTPVERNELWEALWNLEERHGLSMGAVTPEEKALLDSELEDFAKDGQLGSSWAEAESRLRKMP